MGNIYPKISKEWDYKGNKDLTPYDVAPKSSLKVGWKCCVCHRTWRTKIVDRTLYKMRCPYCNNKLVTEKNCLANKYPNIAKEWHPTKNGKLTPQDVIAGTHKKVWWKCSICNYEWLAQINSRKYLTNGCPACTKILLTGGVLCDSLVEAYYYLKFKREKIKFKHNKEYPGMKRKRGFLNTKRYDFFFVDEKKYIEVTSYNKRCKLWKKYYKKILLKKKYVEKKLKCKFEFIQREDLSKEEKELVKKHMVRNKGK